MEQVSRRPPVNRQGLCLYLILVTVLAASLIPYHYVWQRGFSDIDDFLEIHRAITLDLPDPALIFTTSHYGDRYRPVNRLLTDATVALAGVNPNAFLVRNLAFHLASVLIVFLIVLRLSYSRLPAAAAALLFAFHPINTNAVAVAAFTQTFGALLSLVALFVVVVHKDIPQPHQSSALAGVAGLLAVVAFSSETYVWVLPVYALAVMVQSGRSRQRSTYLPAAALALVALVAYIVIRQAVLENPELMARSSVARNGIKDFGQIARNLGMFLVASGLSLDYLHFVNPVDNALPQLPTAALSPGLMASAFAGLLGSVGTIAGSAAIVISKSSHKVVLPLALSTLFVVSISIVTVAVTAAETYLYLPNAFLAMAQGLILAELWNRFDSIRTHRMLNLAMIGILTLVLVTRGAGVENRNQILADKAARVAHLQGQLQKAADGFHGDRIVFVPVSTPPRGYSVYGGRGMGLVSGVETPFAQLTLGDTQVVAERTDAATIQSRKPDHQSGVLILMVDDNGNMHSTDVSSIKE